MKISSRALGRVGSAIMPFSIDPTWLFLSLIPGGIGFVLFVYGKKQGRWPHLVAGLLFMAYPYVATTVLSLTVGGVLLSALLWFAIRLGW